MKKSGREMTVSRIHLEKKGLRGLAIAESFKQNGLYSALAGVVMRRDFIIDGFVFGRSTIGGDDATDEIISMYDKLCRKDVAFVLLSGLIISLYNIVDIKELWNRIKIPVIGVTYGESSGMEDAIKSHFPDSYEAKLLIYEKLGSRTKVSLHTKHDVYLRDEGCEKREPIKHLHTITLQGAMPDPMRVAQLLAKASLDFAP